MHTEKLFYKHIICPYVIWVCFKARNFRFYEMCIVRTWVRRNNLMYGVSVLMSKQMENSLRSVRTLKLGLLHQTCWRYVRTIRNEAFKHLPQLMSDYYCVKYELSVACNRLGDNYHIRCTDWYRFCCIVLTVFLPSHLLQIKICCHCNKVCWKTN